MKFQIQPCMRGHITRIVNFAFDVAAVLGLFWACTAIMGCASPYLPADPAKMTEGQLKALGNDRNVSASCTTAGGPWGTGRTVYIQLDRSAINGGTVSVTQDCQVSVTAEQKGAAK